MNKKIPKFFSDINYILRFLLFALLFSFLFITIYTPFGFSQWAEFQKSARIIIATIILFCAFGVTVLSRMLFYLVSKKIPIYFWQYYLWMLTEIIVIAALYSVFIKYVLFDIRTFPHILLRSVFFIFFILIIPYTLFYLYFRLIEKGKEFRKIKARRKRNTGNTVIEVEQDDLIHFKDDNQTHRLTIMFDKLLYIESFVNYVVIYYEQHDEIVSFHLRSSIKRIENQEFSPQLVRCHRSFMVNFNKIVIFKKEKEGAFLQFENTTLPEIPVSKTYLEKITQKIKHTL